MSATTDHTLDSALAPATNAAGLAPPSSASGSATVGSGGGLLGGTAGTGSTQAGSVASKVGVYATAHAQARVAQYEFVGERKSDGLKPHAEAWYKQEDVVAVYYHKKDPQKQEFEVVPKAANLNDPQKAMDDVNQRFRHFKRWIANEAQRAAATQVAQAQAQHASAATAVQQTSAHQQQSQADAQALAGQLAACQATLAQLQASQQQAVTSNQDAASHISAQQATLGQLQVDVQTAAAAHQAADDAAAAPTSALTAATLASAGKPLPPATPKPKGVRTCMSSGLADLCGGKKGAAVSDGKPQPTAAPKPKPAAKAQISRQSPKPNPAKPSGEPKGRGGAKKSAAVLGGKLQLSWPSQQAFDPAELKFFADHRPDLVKAGILDNRTQNILLEGWYQKSKTAAGGARGNKKDALKRLAPSKAAAKVSSPRNGATKWANYYDLKRDFKALGGGECLSEPWFKEQSLQDRKRFLESQIHAIQHPKKMRMSYRKPQPAAAVESSDDDESQADADATGASADWRPDAWMDKPGVKFDKDACDLFGKRIEMDLNGTREPAVIKAYTPDARAPYGVVFDSQPDTTRWENLLRPGRTDWQEIGWGGDDLVDSETAYLRPVCPHCGIALDEGRAAWTKCLACGECEPGVHAAKVISRMNKDDPYRCPPPAYAESDDE